MRVRVRGKVRVSVSVRVTARKSGRTPCTLDTTQGTSGATSGSVTLRRRCREMSGLGLGLLGTSGSVTDSLTATSMWPRHTKALRSDSSSARLSPGTSPTPPSRSSYLLRVRVRVGVRVGVGVGLGVEVREWG